MLENSLTDGVLFRLRERDRIDESTAAEPMLNIVKAFWAAAAGVFSDAWQLPPKRSRLTHGAGVVSMGFVMDAICERYRQKGLPALADFESDLAGIRDVCRWTDG